MLGPFSGLLGFESVFWGRRSLYLGPNPKPIPLDYALGQVPNGAYSVEVSTSCKAKYPQTRTS